MRIGRNSSVFLIMVVVGHFQGCTTCQRPIQLCPEACKPVGAVRLEYGNFYKPLAQEGESGSASDPREPAVAFVNRLGNQKINYWLTDSDGRPVTSYGERILVDGYHFFASPFMALPQTTRENPAPIQRLIYLNWHLNWQVSDVLIHLFYADTGTEATISLQKSTLEHHDGFDVLYIK